MTVVVSVRNRRFHAPATSARQAQRIDAGMVLLEVEPEASHQVVSQADQCGVVDCRLPFGQIGDEQVTYRSARDRITVDQLGDRALTKAADLLQRRRVGAEHAYLT
jgi:hypothetical protein